MLDAKKKIKKIKNTGYINVTETICPARSIVITLEVTSRAYWIIVKNHNDFQFEFVNELKAFFVYTFEIIE